MTDNKCGINLSIIFSVIVLFFIFVFVLRFSWLWFCLSKFIHSGALIPGKGTAQCEGRRISFVSFALYVFIVFVDTVICLL
jgi:hypothetical protein